MKFLGNIIWLLFGGIITSVEYSLFLSRYVFFYSASDMIFSATLDITLRNYDVLSHCDSILG